MKRPTRREIDHRLRDAEGAVASDALQVLNPESVAADAIELGYLIHRDLTRVLAELIQAATADDYAGGGLLKNRMKIRFWPMNCLRFGFTQSGLIVGYT